MQTVYDLMVGVARHLTGKSIKVRLVRPEGLAGLCWRDETGRLTIDVRPDLSDETMLQVYLHELAHGLHDIFRPATEAVMKATPLSKTPIQAVREDRADSQAKVWLEYAEKYRDRSLDYFEGMLWALLTYQEV